MFPCFPGPAWQCRQYNQSTEKQTFEKKKKNPTQKTATKPNHLPFTYSFSFKEFLCPKQTDYSQTITHKSYPYVNKCKEPFCQTNSAAVVVQKPAGGSNCFSKDNCVLSSHRMTLTSKFIESKVLYHCPFPVKTQSMHLFPLTSSLPLLLPPLAPASSPRHIAELAIPTFSKRQSSDEIIPESSIA